MSRQGAKDAKNKTQPWRAWRFKYVSDFLLTTPDAHDEHGNMESEFYFIIAIFGVEFAINMIGPSVDAYKEWLRVNGGVSPLYYGKNAPSP
jgi:hypothetical protein